MQTKFFSYFALVVVLVLSACKDDNDPAPDANPNEIVTIEGQDYATVKIGTQTWTSANYAGPGGIPFNGNNPKPDFGKYYSRIEAQEIALPAGWRLPTQQDYEKLAAHYGITLPTNGTHTEKIKALTSETDWNHVPGTNASGFNAYPAGYIFQSGPPIPGDIAEFWATEGITFSIQEAGAELSNLRLTFYNSDNSPDYKFNVRFVKD